MTEQGRRDTAKAGGIAGWCRDIANGINKAVTRRWQALDPLLPAPGDLPEGCMAPLLASGDNGRLAGLAICRHQHIPADTMAQTWGTATRFVLTLRLRESNRGWPPMTCLPSGMSTLTANARRRRTTPPQWSLAGA